VQKGRKGQLIYPRHSVRLCWLNVFSIAVHQGR